jgi:HEPN domain-containing protein
VHETLREDVLNKLEAIRLYDLASNFWRLTLNIASELIKSENPSSLMRDGWAAPSVDEIEEELRWSDLHIIEPTLFNFYHGIELSLKALLVAKGEPVKGHGLSDFLEIVDSRYNDSELSEFYGNYILTDNLPTILKDFCRESNVTMDMYYQSLKYPTSNNKDPFTHLVLRGQEAEGVKLFEQISEDLKRSRKKIEKIISSECRDVLA